MIGLGTVINSLCVIAGGVFGMLFGKALSQRVQDTMIQSCGLATMFIGASGALQHIFVIDGTSLSTTGSMLLVICLVLGGFLGELIDIEDKMERFGEWLRVKSRSERDPHFIEGFCAASFTICIGAMAIIGPMNDAIYHDYSLLITKGILDLIIVMALASSLGKGVVFSVIPLAIWQGLMTVLARLIMPVMTQPALDCLSTVGNVLIFCVGVNLVFGKKVKVANFLPALVFAVVWGLTLGL